MKKLEVLIVEDEIVIARDLKRIVELEGALVVSIAARGIRAFSQAPIVYLTGNDHRVSDACVEERHPQGMYAKPPSEAQVREMLGKARVAGDGT